jgi:[ribosomal protein S18]-alanine N-acetyltransferase
MTLRQFGPADAEVVSSWARTPAEVTAWCSHAWAPVPASVIVGWGQEPGVSAYVLGTGRGRIVAYGELWVDHDECEVELARIIVDPHRRNEGIGRDLVSRLADKASGIYPGVFVRVHPGNTAALRCYEAAGFGRVTATEEDQWNRGQPIQYAWMAYRPT